MSRSAMAAQSLGSVKILSHSAKGELVATAVALRSSRTDQQMGLAGA